MTEWRPPSEEPEPVVCSGCDLLLDTDALISHHHCYDEIGLPHFRLRMTITADDLHRLTVRLGDHERRLAELEGPCG